MVSVVFRLKAHEIVCAQLRNDPFVVRQRGEDFRRGKRDVQEEPDRVAMAAVAQHLCQRNEMIIVHPDDIVGSQQLVYLIGKDAH